MVIILTGTPLCVLTCKTQGWILVKAFTTFSVEKKKWQLSVQVYSSCPDSFELNKSDLCQKAVFTPFSKGFLHKVLLKQCFNYGLGFNPWSGN